MDINDYFDFSSDLTEVSKKIIKNLKNLDELKQDTNLLNKVSDIITNTIDKYDISDLVSIDEYNFDRDVSDIIYETEANTLASFESELEKDLLKQISYRPIIDKINDLNLENLNKVEEFIKTLR